MTGSKSTTMRTKAVALASATALLAGWALASAPQVSAQHSSSTVSVTAGATPQGKWPRYNGKKW